jgi:acetyl-CoA carboxylase biotin carboxyl carrier protein
VVGGVLFPVTLLAASLGHGVFPSLGRLILDDSLVVVGECVTVRHDCNVWKIVVAEGDAVSVGDTVVILESMKMEIPVLSEVEGTIAKSAVSEGDVVQQGDLIAMVE